MGFCYLYRKYAVRYCKITTKAPAKPRIRGRQYAEIFFGRRFAARTRNLKISCENLTILAKILQKTLTNKYNEKDTRNKRGIGYGQKQKGKTQFTQIRSDRESQGSYRLTRSFLCFPVWHGTASFIGAHSFYARTDHIMISVRPFDLALPFQSWWILIYVSSFVFWPLCYVMTAKYNSKGIFVSFRFVTADLLSRTICGFFHRAADDQCAAAV